MPHTPLISTIVIGLVLAFVLGALANRLRVSPLVGYLLAGVAVGPFTPGFVADQAIARDLAEIGVILLMFGVGLQFSPKELLSVKAIAIPGALLQIAMATAFGAGLAWAMGWSAATGLVFGLTLSVASTVVVIRVLDERRLIDSEAGRISVGSPMQCAPKYFRSAKLERIPLAARRRGMTKRQRQMYLEAVQWVERQREEQGSCWPGVFAGLAPPLGYTVSATPGLPMQFAK
jgi:hypothetical protein